MEIPSSLTTSLRGKLLQNELLSQYTSWRTGGPADYLFIPADLDDLSLFMLRPAAINTGIIFRRVDLNPIVEIKASAECVGDTTLSTTLIKDNVRVSTVEHLLSAFAGLGIDNAYVDVTASEIPIMPKPRVRFSNQR